MKIIVTGALGHIGSRLIRDLPLAFDGAEIVMLDNMLCQRYCSLFNLPENGKYIFIEGDILSADLVQMFTDADVVIHLAAITNASESFHNAQEVDRVNCSGTVRVAQACIATGKPLIFLSTTSVYGSQSGVVGETACGDELKPQSPYAESKLNAEFFLEEAGEKSGLQFVILRFGTVCGVSPGMRFHTAINKFCWQAVTGQPITVWKTALHQKRPYLALGDAVNALLFLIQSGLYDNSIYNVVTENLAVESIVSHIRQSAPIMHVAYTDSPIMNQLSYEVSDQRIRAAGYSKRGSIFQSIDETIELLRSAGGANVR